MFAGSRACGLAIALAAASPALAEPAQKPPRLKVNLTQKPEPDSKPWEDPARISATIDPHGPDAFSAQINLEVARPLTPATADRQKALKGFIIWNRETGSDDPQNNFEVGAAFSSALNTAFLSDSDSIPFDAAIRASVGYARTAQFPELSSATCVATPAAPQCHTQFKESLRASAAAAFFGPGFERHPTGFLAYSIAPKLGLDHDQLINSPINVDTGLRAHGGYLSAVAGVAVSLFPDFDRPRWEVSVSTQLRQRITASDSRRPSIEKSAIMLEAAATYFVLVPRKKDGWRAGVGIVYSRGDDPLTGQTNVNRIVLALRIGAY